MADTGNRSRWTGVVGGLTAFTLVVFTAGTARADTVRDLQWYLDGMHAEEMWETSKGAGVTVAVIDTGVDDSLPDLRGQVLPGKDFLPTGAGAHTDTFGHGTAMAVLIAGTGKGFGGTGAKGLAPDAKILPFRVMSSSDGWASENTALVKAVRYAADSPAKVINISLAGIARDSELDDAVRYAVSKGKLIFAGSGNEAQRGNPVVYPAASPGVVAVGAVDRHVRVTAESSRGPYVTLAAPGDDMVHSCPGSTGICRSHGTSDASALASASAALLWSAHPDWTANQVLRVLINTAGGPKSGEKRSDTLGYGVVRPRVALKDPGDPGPADVNPLTGAQGASPTTSSPPPARGAGASIRSHPGRAEAGDAGGDTGLWLGVGVGAAVVVSAAVAALGLITRRRRRHA
ncbi:MULTISPECIES: type VII secretion-associated serine protease mycosin [Streptomyces]|uniref:type VII secretion-associated serine protease mycosin n=1 Tax=Streptomyces TaxID=1883 RepID=UPI00163BCD4D|nr:MULTISPECIES: type VII secretion-associated serine protease mycosin [Streptomyces]MBC2877714.1 type VII secretion-associated serine protease mycosin [Streptomyces sp. TYQ1024]UBI41196.1 type VII secretion-associated serine protease mycosin [Streptomyces mobaraensis]UKW33692.1 type VII secretion-associated serine protease mycosin [Streptomyces sp. TYQ1024]